MTPQEFKAWFDGFTDAMEGNPTANQWEKIKERVSQIDGWPVSYPVWVQRSPYLWEANVIPCEASPAMKALGTEDFSAVA